VYYAIGLDYWLNEGVIPMKKDTKGKKGFFDRLNRVEKVLGSIGILVGIWAAVWFPLAAEYGWWPYSQPPDVKIIAAQFDAPGNDNKDNLNGEWVQIKNLSDNDVDMSGWRLCDYGNHHIYHFGEFRLASGATVKVYSGCGTDSLAELYWGSGGHIWNNDGDTASLINLDDVCVSEYSD
jgi:hypothetical protein